MTRFWICVPKIVLVLSHFPRIHCTSTINHQVDEKVIYDDTTDTASNSSHCSNIRRNNMKSYLQNILLQIEHPGSIIVLTDCISGNLDLGEDLQLFSYVSFAFMSPSILKEIRTDMFRESKLFVVVDLPEKESAVATRVIFETYQNSNQRSRQWQPTTLIISEIAGTKDEIGILSETLHGVNLDFDCRIFAVFLDINGLQSSNETGLWEAYNVKSTRIISKFGSISADANISLNSKNRVVRSLENIARRRRNFRQETLIASVKYDPNFDDWIGMRKKDDGTYHLTEGYVAFLYWDLKMLMNFSENVILGDSPWVFPNGSLGGITVLQLNSDETDLTLNQISYSPSRARALTFLHPTYYSFVHAFFKQPTQNSIRDIVIAAFHKNLWITMIGVWAMIVVSVKLRFLLAERWTPCSCSIGFLKDFKFSRETVLWSVASVCQKTWYLDPYSTSLRMKFLIGSFVSFMSFTAYSAAICSSLAVNQVPVKNFIDLISFDFIFTVHEKSEPFQTMLRGMIQSFGLDQDVATVSTEKEISHLYLMSSTIASDIRTTKRVFLSPADMFYKTAFLLNYSDSFICDHITSMHAGSYKTKSAMLVKKDSQFKEVLNYMLLYLSARGLLARNIEGYNAKNFLRCMPIEQQDKKVAPAEYTDIFTIILVLFLGMPMAAFVLILEILYRAIKNGTRICIGKRKNIHDIYKYDEIAKSIFLYTK